INALGIRHVGETTAKLLARNFHTLRDFFDAMKSREALVELDHIGGIGETVASAIVEFFAEKHNREALDHLLPELEVEPVAAPKTVHSAVAGKIGVFTGTMGKMTRPEAKARA